MGAQCQYTLLIEQSMEIYILLNWHVPEVSCICGCNTSLNLEKTLLVEAAYLGALSIGLNTAMCNDSGGGVYG